MEFKQTNILYFSATGTTKKMVAVVAQALGIKEQKYYEIANTSLTNISFPSDEIVIIGFPVFSGRVPQIVKEAIQHIQGNNTPTILVCVYGNRDFDDALLEMKECVEENHFDVISAAAFVAQHSIFPTIAPGRPDASDLHKAEEFALLSLKHLVHESGAPRLTVPGNNPYRPIKRIPLYPKAKKECTACGICAKSCPVQAIDPRKPQKTDKDKCISCARCIAVCPQQLRAFQGIMYALARRKFEKNLKERKEPRMFYRNE